jgi:hypothetical protein
VGISSKKRLAMAQANPDQAIQRRPKLIDEAASRALMHHPNLSGWR